MGTDRYGNRYFGIKTDIVPDGEIYAMADVAETAADGSLVLRNERHINLIIPAGHWTACFGIFARRHTCRRRALEG